LFVAGEELERSMLSNFGPAEPTLFGFLTRCAHQF
jgi:hypothetical protein